MSAPKKVTAAEIAELMGLSMASVRTHASSVAFPLPAGRRPVTRRGVKPLEYDLSEVRAYFAQVEAKRADRTRVSRQEATERAEDMVALRREGACLSEIGDKYGVSRERARQIIARAGGPSTGEAKGPRDEANRLRIAEWFGQNPTGRATECGQALGLGVPTVNRLADPETLRTARRLRVRVVDWATPSYGPEDYRRSLRAAWKIAKEMGKKSLSSTMYDALRVTDAIEGPSAARIQQVYGSWVAAATDARVPAGGRQREYVRKYDREDEVLLLIAEYLSDPEAPGTYHGWNPWKRAHYPDAPSAETLRNRMGTWSKIKARALQQVAS